MTWIHVFWHALAARCWMMGAVILLITGVLLVSRLIAPSAVLTRSRQIIGAFGVALILLSGIFLYFSFEQTACQFLNEIIGDKQDPDYSR